jgi:hypothetical protein
MSPASGDYVTDVNKNELWDAYLVSIQLMSPASGDFPV